MNINLQKIKFLNRNFPIPKSYKRISVDDYIKKIKDSLGRDAYTEREIQRFKGLNRIGGLVEIFADTLNHENSITFHPNNYFKMSKEMQHIYTSMLEDAFDVDYETYGIKYEKIESTFLDYGLAEIIKVKFKKDFNEFSHYFTHYVVSHNLRSFGVIVNNKENIDYQSIFDTYKL
ncbi:hypothetical protein [Winogradskyella wandonensis]|nr:hypothetical protein [Winogradskyella wandonensis]